ncbi:MAG: hypothetical protein SCALA702_14460 [Melioribacteraceae bacterium]|nr:MAG: hypothetical protein SCALA702_14460 [Melioribacteraceae bacterium]
MFKRILLISISIFLFFTGSVAASGIEVEAQYDFQLAVQYATNNNIDTLYLITSGGVYTTIDSNFFFINKPLAIVAKEGLAERPILTHSDINEGVLEIVRVNEDFHIEGVILDGGHEQTHGLKYAIRAGEWEGYPVNTGYNITVKNCIFRDFYQDKEVDGAGHGVYFLKGVDAGSVKVEDCTFENFGDEVIRMTETEKYDTERCLDTLIVRNCSFTNGDAECIRFYADTDTATTDAYVLIENITVNRSATRMMYIKNNRYTTVKNVIVTNSQFPAPDRAERADYVMQIQQVGSYISHVDTLNMVWGLNASDTRVSSTKGGDVDEETIFAFDPDFEDEANFDLRLKSTSHAYFSGENNAHLGDLNNAVVATPSVSPLNVTVVGNGSVTFSPERTGLTFVTGTAVTLTAVADSGNSFVSWSGDITVTTPTANITVDGIKNVVATFDVGTAVEDEIVVNEFKLSQNYPNPFNPSTLINFSLAEEGFTTLKVYDILGKEVAVLVNNNMTAGSHSVVVDGSNFSSGIYFYQIQSGDFTATKKMMLVK